MAPVRKRNTKNGDGLSEGNHQARRNPRKFTDRRQAMVSEFMGKFRANPENYARYGTEEWMESLIDHMNEGPRYGLNTEDINHWLNTDSFFAAGNAEYDYGSLQTQAQDARHQSDDGSGVVVHGFEDLPTKADDDTMPLGPTIKMEVDNEVPDFSNEIIADTDIRNEVDQDVVREPSAELSTPSNEAPLDDTTTAAESLPISRGSRQIAQLPGPVEAVHGAMIRYSQATPGIYPAVLPSQPPGSSKLESIRQLQDYSILMKGMVNDLRNAGCTSINVEGCSTAVNLLSLLLADVEAKMLDQSLKVEP